MNHSQVPHNFIPVYDDEELLGYIPPTEHFCLTDIIFLPNKDNLLLEKLQQTTIFSSKNIKS